MKSWQKLYQKAIQQQQAGNSQAALQLYEQIIPSNPQNFAVYANLGLLYQSLGDEAATIKAYETALDLQPKDSRLCRILGIYYISRENGAKGRPLLEFVWQQDSTDWEVGLILARMYKDHKEYEQATVIFRQLSILKPDLAEPYAELGNIRRYYQDMDEAISLFRQALALEPENVDYHGFLLEALLYTGELWEGFKELEWRKKRPQRKEFYEQFNVIPAWQGEIFSGKKLLVYSEEGLGDTLQFVRYLPLVKVRGGHVTLACQEPLVRLFQSLPGVDAVVNTMTVTEYDLSVALMTLPHVFGTTLATIPAQVPYMYPPPELVGEWQARFRGIKEKKVGVIWTGNSHKDCHIQDLTPLTAFANRPDVKLFSLQKGEGEQQWPQKPAGLPMINLSGAITDFADTAAIMLNLDLIISVDTSTAHLAGALGKPVITVLSALGEWRWLQDREDSPWYPTMRLLRAAHQQESWQERFSRLAKELEAMENVR